jgi:hypothetical protein
MRIVNIKLDTKSSTATIFNATTIPSVRAIHGVDAGGNPK